MATVITPNIFMESILKQSQQTWMFVHNLSELLLIKLVPLIFIVFKSVVHKLSDQFTNVGSFHRILYIVYIESDLRVH